MCFPVNFAKFLKTSFFTEHLRWLLIRLEKTSRMKRIVKKKGLYMKSKQLPLIEKCILSIQFISFLKFIHLKA